MNKYYGEIQFLLNFMQITYMLTEVKAKLIANRWLDWWNEKTVEEYLTQYRDDIILISNIVLKLFPESYGRMTDKAILKNYWEIVRVKFPNYKFILEKVDFYENKVIVFYSTTDYTTKAIGILTVDEKELIYKCEVSYV